MKKITLLGFIFFLVASCSDKKDNVEVEIRSSAYPLIPAEASSCLAQETSGGDAPAQDIQRDYFRIPKIDFKREDTTKTLVLSLIRVTLNLPNQAAYVCEVGGDGLTALRHDWYLAKDAIVPAGQTPFSTTCPMYCGGVNTTGTGPFMASGTMEVFGFEVDANEEETAVKIQTVISVQAN